MIVLRYDPDPKSYDPARAQAFEQHVMDVKVSLFGRPRASCAPVTSPTCLGATCATKLWAAPRVVNSHSCSHHVWLLRRRQRFFFYSLVNLRRRANVEAAPAHCGRTTPTFRVF